MGELEKKHMLLDLVGTTKLLSWPGQVLDGVGTEQKLPEGGQENPGYLLQPA